MQVNLTIGEFSRMTHLSVKTLRHYHRVGLLEPAQVDRHSGYRHYTTDQVVTAQIIRRFRDLDMPVEHLRAVLAAPDPESRNALIVAHLATMEEQLQQTRDAVVSHDDLAFWWDDTFRALHAELRAGGLRRTGPAGGVYDTALFEDERGRATLFIPVADPPSGTGRIQPMVLPSAEYAITVHGGNNPVI